MEDQKTTIDASVKLKDPNGTKPTSAQIQNWIVTYIAQLLEIDPNEIDMTTPFERYGLDSSAMVVLSGDLQTWLGYDLDPTLLYDYPTIEALVGYLAEKI